MAWHIAHDRFLSSSAKLNAIIYATPAVFIALLFGFFDITRPYIVPALLVYLIAAIADMLSYGFQAVCVQIKVCTDFALEHSANTSGSIE